ncbi:GET complex subunit get1 [Pseudogymnoascus verrucosus]|uniref:GET complex subunit get1 n=1 Tax=Pseudogymnoascus verrucosus TaxID=342668 RepID=A0A1B8GE47_9PEZI|nr:GET complex subunit get1 [Pseudogymnoascus verrucosus]OBT94105.1 GET complex subunit get1 [Pseudogymnoascus verrucosus]
MPSLLVTVFILQLAIHLVNTIGASAVNTLLWNLYNSLPTPTSKAFKEQKKLQAEYLAIRKELNSVSAQDQFAKWAKLSRTHDKKLETLEKRKAALDSHKAKFTSVVSALRWLGTNGLRMLIQFWYAKQPMFWLPHGRIPYYAEWLLSCPRAPLGSISIQVWGMACAAVILLVSDAVVAVVGLVMTAKAGKGQQKEKKTAVPMKAGGEKASMPASTEKAEAKKEL